MEGNEFEFILIIFFRQEDGEISYSKTLRFSVKVCGGACGFGNLIHMDFNRNIFLQRE